MTIRDLEARLGHDADTAFLLRLQLQVQVPLYIDELCKLPDAELERRLTEARQVVTEHGDDVLYRSAKPGGTAHAVNKLAEALAILAFVPGGVTAFGLHFEGKKCER